MRCIIYFIDWWLTLIAYVFILFRAFSRHSTSCDIDKHSESCDEKHEKQAIEKNTKLCCDKSNGNSSSFLQQKKGTKNDYQTFDNGNGASVHINQQNDDSHIGHSHQENGSKVKNGRRIALRDFFTVLALSIHAIFEGMAIGLEEHSADIWILFAGNRVHKFFSRRHLRYYQELLTVEINLLISEISDYSCRKPQICHLLLCWIGIA